MKFDADWRGFFPPQKESTCLTIFVMPMPVVAKPISSNFPIFFKHTGAQIVLNCSMTN
jgi:hypothetical protein